MDFQILGLPLEEPSPPSLRQAYLHKIAAGLHIAKFHLSVSITQALMDRVPELIQILAAFKDQDLCGLQGEHPTAVADQKPQYGGFVNDQGFHLHILPLVVHGPQLHLENPGGIVGMDWGFQVGLPAVTEFPEEIIGPFAFIQKADAVALLHGLFREPGKAGFGEPAA